MYKIPKNIIESLEEKILVTLRELGYKDVTDSGIIPVGNEGISVTFGQAQSSDFTHSLRNFGNISIEYRRNYTIIIARRLKVTFDWKEVGYVRNEATDFHWSEETTRKLKDKVKQVYQVAKQSGKMIANTKAMERHFCQEVLAVFPNAVVKGMEATVDGYLIYKDDDSFRMAYSFMRYGSLEEIKQLMALLSKYRERE